MFKTDSYTQFEQTTIDQVKMLGAARAELEALKRGTRTTLWIDDNLYVFARVSAPNAAGVVINREWNPRSVSVPVPASVPLANRGVLNDCLGGASVTVPSGALQLTTPPHSSQVLAP